MLVSKEIADDLLTVYCGLPALERSGENSPVVMANGTAFTDVLSDGINVIYGCG